MGKEIERKFLLVDDSWKKRVVSSEIFRQRYISTTGNVQHRTIRLRLAGDRAFLTLKTAACGIERNEYEYEIPFKDGTEIFEKLCDGPSVEKRRHIVLFAGNRWEIDEFSGDNTGLILAEIELPDENASFERPPWLGKEVSSDHRYANTALSRNPFKNWKNAVS